MSKREYFFVGASNHCFKRHDLALTPFPLSISCISSHPFPDPSFPPSFHPQSLLSPFPSPPHLSHPLRPPRFQCPPLPSSSPLQVFSSQPSSGSESLKLQRHRFPLVRSPSLYWVMSETSPQRSFGSLHTDGRNSMVSIYGTLRRRLLAAYMHANLTLSNHLCPVTLDRRCGVPSCPWPGPCLPKQSRGRI